MRKRSYRSRDRQFIAFPGLFPGQCYPQIRENGRPTCSIPTEPDDTSSARRDVSFQMFPSLPFPQLESIMIMTVAHAKTDSLIEYSSKMRFFVDAKTGHYSRRYLQITRLFKPHVLFTKSSQLVAQFISDSLRFCQHTTILFN